MVDLLWTFVGFLVGVVAAGFAVEFGLRKFLSPPESSKLTRVWTLTELPTPLIATRGVEGVHIPRSAKLVVSDRFDGARDGFELRHNGETIADFAVDAKLSRAILFLGGIRKGSLALWTVDESLIERLRTEFHRLWTRSTDYVERVTVGRIADRANAAIETEGTVQDIVPYKDHFLLRLSDDGETVGVLVNEKLDLAGRRVNVRGLVRTSSSGYPLVEAVEVRTVTR